MRQRELTEEEICTILLLGRQGMLYHEIARQVNRSKSTVQQQLAKHGIHRATVKNPVGKQRPSPLVLALPVPPDGFIKAPTRERLMAGR